MCLNLWINQSYWQNQHIKYDTWYTDEPGIFERCQNLTTKTKVKFECARFLNKDYPGESENKLIARINKHTWKHSLKILFVAIEHFMNTHSLKWVNFVDQPVVLTISTYQIWYFVQWWTSETWEWPVPYNTDKGQLMVRDFNQRLSWGKVWYHKSSHMVEARGSWQKLSAKAHDHR